MSLYKDKYYILVKMFINQFLAFFLAWILLFSTSDTDWLCILGSAFATLFYVILLFFSTCEVGIQDCIPIEAGRMKRKWYKGTLYALVANAPAILACLVACVVYPFKDAGGEVVKNIFAISHGINELFLHVMYKGILFHLPGNIGNTPYIYLPIILISILLCTLGYLAGTKGMFSAIFVKRHEK